MTKSQKIPVDDPNSLRDKHLTPKQQAFVDNYVATFNASQSAIDAGYSPKSARMAGCENLTKPNISAAIANGLAKKRERRQFKPDDVLDSLLRLAVKAEQTNQLSPAIRAHELIGKQIGMFSDRLQVDTQTTHLVIHTVKPELQSAVIKGIQAGQQERSKLPVVDAVVATDDADGDGVDD